VLYHLMSQATERNVAYRAAIDRHVRDKVVLDLGTGAEAILARFCVEPGRVTSMPSKCWNTLTSKPWSVCARSVWGSASP